MKLLAAMTPITLLAPKTAAFTRGLSRDLFASCYMPMEAPQENAMQPLKAANYNPIPTIWLVLNSLEAFRLA